MKISKILLGLSLAAYTTVSMADETMTVKAETVQAVISPPVVEAVQKDENTILVSPRTGMRYTVKNPANVPIIFKTELIAPATAANVNRIVATNPALSAISQEKAQAALLEMVTPIALAPAQSTAQAAAQ